jgi:glutamyl-tRNA synthetase
MIYAIDLLKKGLAYPCFATTEELAQSVKDQQARKLRPGYYGEWALWRDRSDEDVQTALERGKPFVLRLRSNGSHQKRIVFNDVLKGRMELPENDLDVPLIKSDEWRLPTYHLAHVVDDFLMGSTIILRGEEWLPSTPLHIELASALGIEPFNYAHLPHISIIDPAGGGKRKLSKRKDPEADVAFWLKAGYPLKSVKAYLLGLANSNFEDWYRANPDTDLSEFDFSLAKLSSSRSPLLDMKKLEDYSKDEIARMSQEHFNKEILNWSQLHDKTLYGEMMKDPDYTKAVLAIERTGDNPRKDVVKWSDAPEQFGYFYDDIFELNILPRAKCDHEHQFSADSKKSLEIYLNNFDYNDDKETWFEKMKNSALEAGYALDRKELKQNPDKYRGGIADFAGLIRLHLTGKTRTPDLYEIIKIMGSNRVIDRLKA